MTTLVVTAPGGQSVATEEILVLGQELDSIGALLADAWRTVNHPTGPYLPEGYREAVARLAGVADDVSWLCRSLVAYTQQVAEQERWRTRLWDSTRDHWTRALVWSALGQQGVRGGSPDASFDDAAEALRRLDEPYHPAVSTWEVDRREGVGISQGVAERIARIPEGSNPVRVERYATAEGEFHTEVFVAGTRTWSLDEKTDPFDMRSNLALVAGAPAASTMVTERAMRSAGVQRGDRVVFVGHSQGGAVAATLAESGRYDTRGLVTVGAPVGSQPAGGEYPALRIEHRDDVVVDLAGKTLPGGHTVVEADSGATTGDIPGAHSRDRYFQTATQIDQSNADLLSGWADGLPGPLRGQARWFDASQDLSGGEVAGGKTAQ
ncbi:hypothetical protein [Pontimonas sp.]|uniref:hypothetical protein n=1 Tax=Pontimonas sp. TaxID=2304492 RepID=UPI0028704CA1|nr:hypothetical protein [Pontimonas sp.]MDR9434208.1 hypothetical protein [Pontimonas sp.]